MSSDRLDAVPVSLTSHGSGAFVETRFIPQRYEPNYPYPLLVMFHSRGHDEQQMLRTMPAMSWRNYVGLSLRGEEPVIRRGRLEGYGWGPDFARRDAGQGAFAAELPEGEVVRRRLELNERDPIDRLEDGAFGAIRETMRSLHVHSERIFLVGIGEGAAVAYRLGLSFPERFAGVVAINGWIPGGFRPLGRLKACRELSILAVHGEWNARVPIAQARRDVSALRAGGLNVAFQSYPCAQKITSPMLADVDTWIIRHCTQGY